MAKFKFLSLLISLMLITPVANAADMKTEAAAAMVKAQQAAASAKRANARIDKLEPIVMTGNCTDIVDELNRGEDPWRSIPADVPAAERQAKVDAKIKSCKDEYDVDIQPYYNAWLARGGTPAFSIQPRTSGGRRADPPSEAPTGARDTSSPASASTVVVEEDDGWSDRGWRLAFGAGAAGMNVDGHSGMNVDSTSFLGSLSGEAKYNFPESRIGLGVRGTFFQDVKGGMVIAGHLVPNFYVDPAASFFRLEPSLGFSLHNEGEYEESRVEVGLSVAGRFARNWEVIGAFNYGVDPDTANTPDNGVRYGLEFRGTFGVGN